MRTLGKLYSNMADLMWFLTVIAFVFLLGIFPQVSVMPVPYYGGTVAQLLIMLMAPAIVVLVFFNLLSGRWPVADHRKRNVWTARLACGALILTALIVFLVNKGATGLPVLTLDKWTLDVDMLAKIGLFGTMAFAIIDAVFTKGDDFVVSSSAIPHSPTCSWKRNCGRNLPRHAVTARRRLHAPAGSVGSPRGMGRFQSSGDSAGRLSAPRRASAAVPECDAGCCTATTCHAGGGMRATGASSATCGVGISSPRSSSVTAGPSKPRWLFFCPI